MKRLVSICVFALFSIALLSACGGGSSSSASSTSVPSASQPATSSLPQSSGSTSSSFAESGPYDVNMLMGTVAEAAGLGDTIEMGITELTASGEVDASNIVAMAGAQSKAYATNGGMVVAIQATSADAATTVAGQLQLYMDGLLAQTENYKTDYPEAFDHMSNVRIVTELNYVVFAVSATGDYDALDTAIAALFV